MRHFFSSPTVKGSEDMREFFTLDRSVFTPLHSAR